ncbi:MAG: FAD-dependent oxidoreductase [Candidatus Omnitrophota bacterium]
MQYIILGSSAAGINAVEAIRTKDKTSKIIVISDEARPLYSRCLISYLLAGTISKEKIWYRKDSFFKDNSVESVLGVKAEKIDPKKKEVVLNSKKKIKFDKLLIASGSSPKMEDIPGIDKERVFPLRTLSHTENIQKLLPKVKNVAILGGGLIGLRAAYALNAQGKKVTVFVRSPQVLSQIIDEISAKIMRSHIEKKGIIVKTGISAKEVLGDKSVKGLLLSDRSKYDCELIIVGKGVNSNIGLAKDIGIKTNWGILVDKYQATSNKDIFAAGDVAESFDIALGESSINAIWPAACEQGRIAGLNMAGVKTAYDGSLAMNSIEFFGLPVISIGITKPKKDIHEEIYKLDEENSIYKKIILKDNVIVGCVFLNKVDNIGVVGALIKNKVDVSSIKDIILEDYFDYGKIVKLIKASKTGFKDAEFKETIMTL